MPRAKQPTPSPVERAPTRQRGGRLPHEAEPEAVETGRDLIGMAVEDAGDGALVLTPDRQHAAVVVATLHLDHAQVTGQHLALLPTQLLDRAEVDGDRSVVASVAAHPLGEIDHLLVAGARADP